MNRMDQAPAPADDGHPREVDFYVINADFDCGEQKSPKNTGTLINVDSAILGMLTTFPLQPGNIVEFEHKGESKYGIVMWSVESSSNFRVQVRFV